MQGKPPDWQDFVGITVLLIINSTISFIEENNAGNAAAALMAGLAPKTKVQFNIPLTLCILMMQVNALHFFILAPQNHIHWHFVFILSDTFLEC